MSMIDLSELVKKDVLIRTGKAGRGTAYQLTQLTNN